MNRSLASSRSQTPPVSRGRNATTSPPPLKPNTSTLGLVQKNYNWVGNGQDDDSTILGGPAYVEDEDEFGLPSIANVGKSTRQGASQRLNFHSATRMKIGRETSFSEQTLPIVNDQADIGDERGVPQYPNAKKTVGKILRPQYKEILRGNVGHELQVLSFAKAGKILRTLYT